MKSKFQEKVLSEKEIFKGKVVELVVQDVELPNGEKSQREIIKHNGAVAIMAIKNDKIAMVRQWRAPFKEETLEIPAGKINIDEVSSNPVEIAERELREETGLKAFDFKKITTFYGSPGYSNEKLILYQAIEPQEEYSNLQLDDDEFLNVEWLSLEEAKNEMNSGKIRDGKTQIAILNWELQILKGKNDGRKKKK